MTDLVAIAKEAAQRAGKIIVSFLGNVPVEHKGENYNLVTVADRQSEKLIVNFLRAEMPGCSILSEETLQETDLSADRLWIVDPLDGTTNFAHGIPHFGISVAYAEKGTVLAGVVFDPMRQELISAISGKGAYCNGERIYVSKSPTLAQSLIATGFFYERGAIMEKTLSALHGLFKKEIHCMRRMGAASLDLAWLAMGRFDGYFEYRLSPWDFAAGLLIVKEAGGRASGHDGMEAGLFSKGLFCSNGLIHEELLGVVMNPAAKFD
jgi:myo-inositol-1(or 4)-monophosphatase